MAALAARIRLPAVPEPERLGRGWWCLQVRELLEAHGHFRFNRRNSRSRGLLFYRLLELAVDHDPVRYRQLVADSTSKNVPPVPPWRRGHPPSLDRPRAQRPWRAAR